MANQNGAKAAQKRERNMKKMASLNKKPSSQLKTNEKALTYQCNVCKQTFLCTTKREVLQEHAENKHKKTLAEAFPDLDAPEEE
ncbi:hypothetical protein C9374_011716 [Naegleria lovaniensis]|uniref:Uncharacterized protein n=1 Tax=Naegleria lovaniensis TaxID=51637 RepID=A0AA88GGT9_NAELO|nr:uncharacterized protein C9374_011716 [Naegleria lovaniensis]KAG2373831.1 hypothetical protein C9374_011716 [Naegleria lovaniensis]